VLRGEHVELRAIEREDLPQLLEWRNRPALRRNFRQDAELGMADQEAWFERVVHDDPNTIMFAIAETSSHRLLGATGLCGIDRVNRHAEISIYIGVDDLYVDEVLAPEAARMLLSYGFTKLGLHRIWAEVYAFDDSKRKLFDRLNFSLEGRFREHHLDNGSWHDSLFFGLLAGEFDA
jgi:RimJ/RimL family protein N-acetyltransferase